MIAKPAGTAAGDVLVASLALNGATVAGVPLGWVQIAALTTISNPKAYAYYRVAASGEPLAYSWTLSTSGVSSGGIARYSGVSAASPLDSSVSTVSSAVSVSSLTVPGVTTVGPNAMLVGAVALNSSNSTVLITAPSGMTERWDLSGKRQEYNDVSQGSPGNTGSKTWTISQAREAVAWLAALRPAAGGGTGPIPTPMPSSTPTSGSTPTPTPTATPTSPAGSTSPTPAAGGSIGKGIALRPFAEYWGNNATAMNSDFADMIAGNVTWARIDLFSAVSPNPNFDAAVQGAQDHNINLLVVVHKTPPSNDLGTEADRAAYRSWLAQMVNRYKHYVKYWEIHNEPNLHYEWNIDDSAGSNQAQYQASVLRYVAHLQDGFETVKANDPGATVLIGGLSEWTAERYMDVLLTTDAHQYFDIMSFHPYGLNPDAVLSRFNAFKAKMNSNPSYAAKPIWVTETGYNTTWSSLPGKVSSEQQKADYLAQTMPRLHAAGAQLPLFWYTLHENENASGFGLTLKDRTTLETQFYPAFFAYRDLALGAP